MSEQEIKSEKKRILMNRILIGLAIIPIVVVLLIKASPITILAGFLLLWLAVGLIWVALVKIQEVELQGNTLMVKRMGGLIRESYDLNNLQSYRLKAHYNHKGKFEGIILGFDNGKRYHLHGWNFRDVNEVINQLQVSEIEPSKVKKPDLTIAEKVYIGLAGIIAIMMIVELEMYAG